MTDRCAFWIASKDYLDEAHNSFVRFKRIMPDIETHLFYIGDVADVDNYITPDIRWFDGHTVKKPEHDLWYLNSTMAMELVSRSLNKNLLYLDTDTYLVEPVYELFEMLEHGFDFIAAHAPGRYTAKTVEHIPDAFPEFNIGVCGFGKESLDMLRCWYIQYSKYQDIYGNNDQAPLRETLWKFGGTEIATLTPEYNFRFNFGGFLRYPVKVLHGRHPDLARVANSVNKEKGMRVWKLSDMD